MRVCVRLGEDDGVGGVPRRALPLPEPADSARPAGLQSEDRAGRDGRAGRQQRLRQEHLRPDTGALLRPVAGQRGEWGGGVSRPSVRLCGSL